VKDPTPPTATNRENPAPRAPGRARWSRDGHDEQPLAALDLLGTDAVEAEQHVTAGTRAGSRARISAPRTIVRHVEVLDRSSSWRY
jgi:hypothetical protein